METATIVSEPQATVIASAAGGRLELIATVDPAPRLCSVRGCNDVASTALKFVDTEDWTVGILSRWCDGHALAGFEAAQLGLSIGDHLYGTAS